MYIAHDPSLEKFTTPSPLREESQEPKLMSRLVDPWFNFRATKYLVEHGFYPFWDWFDDRKSTHVVDSGIARHWGS